MNTQEKIGYPSIDKPWMKYYSNYTIKRTFFPTIYESLRTVWSNDSEAMLNYYDTLISSGDFFAAVSNIAKSLIALGVQPGDSIAVSLESVPEFIELLLACELLGIHLKSNIGDPSDILMLIQSCSSTLYFTHDYLSEAVAAVIYERTKIEHIVMIPPLTSVKSGQKVRANIQSGIEKRYTAPHSNDRRDISWVGFIQLGASISELPTVKPGGPLFSAFTSGSTGAPKEVILTSESILGVVRQLAIFPFPYKGKDTWLLTILPPTLVAVVIAMMLYPLADGKRLLLDPFCEMQDLDIEMMHYRPNGWAVIPIFFEALLASTRIPDDYDLGFFKLLGFGAEPISKRFAEKVQHFLDLHHCRAPFGSGYGQSEGGSDFTVGYSSEMILAGSAGIPLIDTTISIFKPGTIEELPYGEIGEICKCGPGLMLGYADENKTNEVLKKHSDGETWLHTGDYGFMTQEGLLFVLGREQIKVYPDKTVYPIVIENKILDCCGIKEAIVVAGTDKKHDGFEMPCLFVISESDEDQSRLLERLKGYIEENLLPEERPGKIKVISQKPISHFKTDRMLLHQIMEQEQ